jgi:hypothetical protein
LIQTRVALEEEARAEVTGITACRIWSKTSAGDLRASIGAMRSAG